MHFKVTDALFSHVDLVLAVGAERNVGWLFATHRYTLHNVPRCINHRHIALPDYGAVEAAIFANG